MKQNDVQKDLVTEKKGRDLATGDLFGDLKAI